MVLAYGATGPSANTVPGTVSIQGCTNSKTLNVYFHDATVERHSKIPSKKGSSWQRSFPVGGWTKSILQGPMLWPPRSSDLNPCDFLLGHLKQLVYSQPINSVKEPTGRVVATSAHSGRSWSFFKGRVSIHFQHLLRYVKSNSLLPVFATKFSAISLSFALHCRPRAGMR
jgi:hypothetical protein